MSEILVTVFNAFNPDAKKNTKLIKYGDVVIAKPDGFIYGFEERTLPMFRIIRAPNISVGFAETFYAEEFPVDENDQRETLWSRNFYMDISAMKGQLKKYMDDDTRADEFFETQFSEAQIAALKLQKPFVPDPDNP